MEPLLSDPLPLSEMFTISSLVCILLNVFLPCVCVHMCEREKEERGRMGSCNSHCYINCFVSAYIMSFFGKLRYLGNTHLSPDSSLTVSPACSTKHWACCTGGVRHVSFPCLR